MRRKKGSTLQARKGLPGGAYRPLTEEDIAQIHATSMKVFEEVGIQINSERALSLFKDAGASVETENRIVKMPGQKVMEIIENTPHVVKLYGRNSEHHLEIGGNRVHMGTGGTALYIIDAHNGERRPAVLEDLKNIARLVQALENIHFFMLPVYPQDVPSKDVDVNRFLTALNFSEKHVMGGVYTLEGIRNVIKMGEIIAGSKQAFRQKPFISMVTCPISPFKLDQGYSELTMEIARAGIPVVTPAEPLCGATAPVTLAGNLVVQNVDTIAGILLTQLVNPGTPVLYGCISSITDLRDMKYLSGAIEMGLMNAAAAQMAQFYRLPYYATAGMSDAKTNDAQAGYESALTGLMVALSGANYIHDAAGFLEFCLSASYEKYVIDNEIIGMIMRAVEGIKVNEETLAFDLIKKIGPGGHFVSAKHTRRYMRKEHYTPQLSNRDTREVWEEAGKKETRERAREQVRAILSQPERTFIPDNVRHQLREEIPGLDPRIL